MPTRRLTAAGCGVLVALLVVGAHPVAAGTYLNTVDDTATLGPSGREARVTGPIGCDAGELVEIRVVLVQASTGAVGEGTFHARCTGDRAAGTTQPWTVHATTRGGAPFEPGPAVVEAWARTTRRGERTDRTHWQVDVELVARDGPPRASPRSSARTSAS